MALYKQELLDLLQEYLADGIITAKERSVLHRKAEKMGYDVEEFDLYIDAQEQKIQQQAELAASKRKGQNCPYCGGSVPQLTDKCPHCGQHMSVEADDELKEIIDNLEDALVDFKSGKDFVRSKAVTERYIRKANLYYSNNPKIKILLDEVNTEMSKASKKYSRKNAWYKKHPYLTAFFIVLGCSLLLGFIKGDEYWLISLFITVFGGMIIASMAERKNDAEEKEKELRIKYGREKD